MLLWTGFSYAFWRNETATLLSLVALNLSVAAIIWLNVFVSTRQVHAQLARSAELDRTLRQLQQSQKSNEELEALKNVACRTLETRSVFFSEASHDFRQKLHAAKLWVSSAMAVSHGDGLAVSPLDRLGRELDALQTYIDQVLDFARMEAMDVGVHLQRTSIQSLFQKLDLSFESASEHAGKTLRFHRTSAVASTDAAMLLRILENLVSNALKYTRGGILICARRRGSCLALQVWDQGPGIQADAHQRIFEAFYREEELDAYGRRHKGLGLGLAIVKRFADRLGYAVQVRSVLGKGSCFAVLIPMQCVEQGMPKRSRLQPIDRGVKRRDQIHQEHVGERAVPGCRYRIEIRQHERHVLLQLHIAGCHSLTAAPLSQAGLPQGLQRGRPGARKKAWQLVDELPWRVEAAEQEQEGRQLRSNGVR